LLAFTTQALFWDFEQSRSGGIGVGLPIVALWTKLRDFKLPSLSYVHNNELTIKKGINLCLIYIETILHLTKIEPPFVLIEISLSPILNYVNPS
jgi:hypothetical protein